MKRQQSAFLLAALLGLLLPGVANAAITHVNVDDFTLPGGPVQIALDVGNPPVYGAGIKTFNFIATNTGATALTDVRYLLQFVQATSPTSSLTFNDGTDTWSDGTNTLSWISSGILLQGGSAFPMANTNAPLSVPPYGTLSAGATVPQVLLGNMAPSGTVAFTIQANLSSNFPFLNVGSSVAVPEPSSLALLGLGAVALVFMGRRRAGSF